MPGPDIRHRTGYLFLAVAVGHIILISAQVNTRGGVPVIEAVVFGTFAEVQRVASWLAGGVGGLLSNYIALRGARSENEELRRRVSELEVQLQEQRARAEESARLRALLEMRTSLELETTGAEVIAGGVRPDEWSLTIDKGTRAGLTKDMAVLSPAGVVGRIVLTTPRASKVQLLVDRSAAVAALVSSPWSEGADTARPEGIVVGTGGGLKLEYLSSSADVQEGDEILTSGMDGIYPKGFRIGKVTRALRGPAGYALVEVQPAVEFDTIEAVLVVKRPAPRLAEAQGAF
ncbi:MAG: rod shape-determining protein MreC [Vicinamibacterales bacterium]